MGRKAEPGISYYKMNCGHTLNKKVRLLIKEYKGDGYWVWQCFLDHGYMGKGYFFDCTLDDELEVFANDICKEDIETVQKIIDCCLRRGLFDKRLYEEHKILTSVMMQETYLEATAERRRKGTEIEFQEEYLLIKIPENSRNISILPRKNPINPRNKSILPVNNLQSKVEYSKVEESKEHISVGVPAAPPRPKKEAKPKKENPPEPHWDKLVEVWFTFNVEQFNEKPSFDGQNPLILKRIVKRLKKRAAEKNVEWTEAVAVDRFRSFLAKAFKEDWLSKHFLLANLENQFDVVAMSQGARKNEAKPSDSIQFLYELYCENGKVYHLLADDHFKLFPDLPWKDFTEKARQTRINSLIGSNESRNIRLLDAYQTGKTTKEVYEDTKYVETIAKKMALIQLFATNKHNQVKTLQL